MNLCFKVHNLEKFSSNLGKVHFEGLVHLLRYIRDSKNLGLGYYTKIEYEFLYEVLIKDSINTYNQFMVISDSTWKNYPDTERSTGAYVFF